MSLARAHGDGVHVPVRPPSALHRVRADAVGEARAVGLRAVFDHVVQAREQLDVDVDVIEEERVQHLPEEERRPGGVGAVARALGGHHAAHLARAADREHVGRAERERRGDGGVLPEPAVEVEVIVDPDGREEQGDRGARERVDGPDVRLAVERPRRGAARASRRAARSA
jgi:hypothetical protein